MFPAAAEELIGGSQREEVRLEQQEEDCGKKSGYCSTWTCGKTRVSLAGTVTGVHGIFVFF